MNLIGQPAGARHLQASIAAHLDGLGRTPDQVAETLRYLEVRGIPGDTHACAIARYLSAVIGGEDTVARVVVTDKALRVVLRGPRLPVRVRLSPVMTAFVRGFDAGSYPDLVVRRRWDVLAAPEPHPPVG